MLLYFWVFILFWAVVTDSLNIVHWRCNETGSQLECLARARGDPLPNWPYHTSLENAWHWYCQYHHELFKSLCKAQPSGKVCLPGKDTCGIEDHVEASNRFETRGHSHFQLLFMLKRPGSNLSVDPTVYLNPETGELNYLDALRTGGEEDWKNERGQDGPNGEDQGGPKAFLCTHLQCPIDWGNFLDCVGD